MDSKTIKVDGVCLNVDFVKGLKKADFIKSPTVRGLFHRIAEKDKDKALGAIHETIAGKEKRKQSGGDTPPPAVDNIIAE